MKRMFMLIPLTSPQGWEVLQYKNIPAHEVSWSSTGMTVQVRSSASPIIYALKQPYKVKQVQVKGRLSSRLTLPAGKNQGEKGADDFELRLGMVVPGENQLTWLQRKLAPAWVLKLQSLAPAGLGIDKVHFYNLPRAPLTWSTRIHPLSEFFQEHALDAAVDGDGRFDIKINLPQELNVAALWIAIDGDDLKQNFECSLEFLTLSP